MGISDLHCERAREEAVPYLDKYREWFCDAVYPFQLWSDHIQIVLLITILYSVKLIFPYLLFTWQQSLFLPSFFLSSLLILVSTIVRGEKW